ncbi:short-chain dehydrogenase [Burkholderia mayonis]|uniref:Short-chain dehydrogenase n=1 Tax=Burkholderia mayonis TaxID=1385591 RepID=A0A1B4FEH0_9BURK|nr:oxidoreductase [Burkholderia mayonis]AOJ02098.1 short-chain dehydrogenase [Burkholderia mayonis]KVE44043.1 short-chain dehydrogenase [Burkholderia mayonis]
MTTHASGKRVALVTGASSGMGKAFAKALLAEGMTVYAAARRVEQMADLVALGATVLKMDVTREADLRAAVERIERETDGADVLINNAGFGMFGAMEETRIDDARYQFEVNLFGMARLTQLVLPSMRAKRAGRIINISSMGGKIYSPLGSWYHATKHAVEGWSDCLRLELQPFGIDVVIVEPGAIVTEFGDVMLAPMLERSGNGPYAKMAAAVAAATKMLYQDGRGSDPQVIVDLIVRAVRARRPRTRYVAGRFARPTMFARKWLGDRIFDKLVMLAMKQA